MSPILWFKGRISSSAERHDNSCVLHNNFSEVFAVEKKVGPSNICYLEGIRG